MVPRTGGTVVPNAVMVALCSHQSTPSRLDWETYLVIGATGYVVVFRLVGIRHLGRCKVVLRVRQNDARCEFEGEEVDQRERERSKK